MAWGDVICYEEGVDASFRWHDEWGGVWGMAGEKGGWVYIMTNRPNGILYTGVTADLIRRVYEHREGLLEGFTRRYALKTLVYFERHEEILAAIAREKAIKAWKRAWKVQLILKDNSGWDDLYEGIL